MLICPQASGSTSAIWTRIKEPNTNSCAEISHVSIYSYFVNLCTTHAAHKMTHNIRNSLPQYIILERDCMHLFVEAEVRMANDDGMANTKARALAELSEEWKEATFFVWQNVL